MWNLWDVRSCFKHQWQLQGWNAENTWNIGPTQIAETEIFHICWLNQKTLALGQREKVMMIMMMDVISNFGYRDSLVYKVLEDLRLISSKHMWKYDEKSCVCKPSSGEELTQWISGAGCLSFTCSANTSGTPCSPEPNIGVHSSISIAPGSN